MNWKQSLLVSVKEFLKVAIIAIIPIVTMAVSSGQVDWKAVSATIAVALLNALNEFLKKSDSTSYNGIIGQ